MHYSPSISVQAFKDLVLYSKTMRNIPVIKCTKIIVKGEIKPALLAPIVLLGKFINGAFLILMIHQLTFPLPPYPEYPAEEVCKVEGSLHPQLPEEW